MQAEAAGIAADRWVTIDRDWILTNAGKGAPAHTVQAVGVCVWDAFPGSEPHFRPIYEAAWKNGMSSGLALYNGVVVDMHVFVRDDQLHVSYQFLTVSGLRDVVDHLSAVAQSAESFGEREIERPRHLRILP